MDTLMIPNISNTYFHRQHGLMVIQPSFIEPHIVSVAILSESIKYGAMSRLVIDTSKQSENAEFYIHPSDMNRQYALGDFREHMKLRGELRRGRMTLETIKDDCVWVENIYTYFDEDETDTPEIHSEDTFVSQISEAIIDGHEIYFMKCVISDYMGARGKPIEAVRGVYYELFSGAPDMEAVTQMIMG